MPDDPLIQMRELIQGTRLEFLRDVSAVFYNLGLSTMSIAKAVGEIGYNEGIEAIRREADEAFQKLLR